LKNKVVILFCVIIAMILSNACARKSDLSSVGESKITVHTWGNEFFLGPRMDVDGKFLVFLPLHGGLLRSWEYSSDYRKWKFRLRRDVRWHDGVPVTAHDIKFSLELFFHPDVLYLVDFPRPESILVLDDFTLTITFSIPQWALEGWTVYYPKHLLEDLNPKEFYEWDFWKNPVGNGPYRYVRHVPKTMIEYEANPDYYRGKPKIDKIVLKFGGNPITELLSGNVDLIDELNAVDISKIKKDSDFRIYHFPHYAFLDVILWNHSHPLFRDSVVRRALTMAINRRELINSLNCPDDVLIFDVISSIPQLRREEVPDPLPYDPKLANQLLKEAGWQDEDENGILERNGQEFRFTTLVRSFDVGVKMYSAVYIQEQFRQIGIRMEIQRIVERIHETSQPWAAAIYSFWNNIATPEHGSGILRFFGAGKKESPIGYKNPQVIVLLEEIQKKVSPEDQERIFSQLMPILRKDIPMTILYPHHLICASHKKIRGLDTYIKDHGLGSPLQAMWHLWIEQQK
jgi:peptide/nickel transport system substrate-binding protein